MTQILVLSGRKQSGKTTCRNFLYGHIMRKVGIIDRPFGIKKDGTLWVPTITKNTDGSETEGMGMLDLDDVSPEFIEYASNRIWPFIKSYSFADELKNVAISVFGLSYEQCFGTNEDKNTLTNIPWENVMFALSSKKKKEIKDKISDENNSPYMTAREFLQIFGTEICRKIYGDCWVDSCFRRIISEQPGIAVITDARFSNEIEAAIRYGATVVRFNRGPFKGKDEHESETALDTWDEDQELRTKYTIWCDNSDMSIEEQNAFILRELIEKKVLPE